MNAYDLIAVVLVCLTCLGCCYILADRWYAHRDRAEQALRISAEQAARHMRMCADQTVEDARKAVTGHLARATADTRQLAEDVRVLSDAAQRKGWS